MAELLTSAQMRALEAAAIGSGKVTGRDLMERAGEGVVAAILAEWPAFATQGARAVVLCGPGNNGGDGFVVARLLAARGWAVRVFLYGDAARLPLDAQANFDLWREMGSVGDYWDFDALRRDYDLVIDALFGIGMTRPMEVAAQADHILHACGGPGLPSLVAVDVPTGLDADTGHSVEPHFSANLTVTFHRAKTGHYLGDGPERSGRLVVADIGLAEVPQNAVRLVGPPETRRLDKRMAASLRWRGELHKFAHGHALVLSGGVGRGGAARLAARAALRVGAGLVTLAAPPAALIENAARLDAVMLRPLRDEAALADMLGDARINALCLGPGLGLERAREMVPAALASGRPCVLDADALSAYADDPDTLFGALHPACVLTPHGGEFARLYPDLSEGLAKGSKAEAARAAAARAGCLVLLKGADTVIASPDGRCAIHAAAYGRAAPWLATAGAGDVLSGMIAGLLSRGLPGFDAMQTAAWLHVQAARRFGPGLIAEDLPDQLPGVFRDLGL